MGLYKKFWTGKTYISTRDIVQEPSIITIAWKWLGDETVSIDTWDNKKQCDKKLLKGFLKEYNQADMVIGYNNDNFDNRWINAQAICYGFEVNTSVKSFDLIKPIKKNFRFQGYSMDYVASKLGTQTKIPTGFNLWNDVQFETNKSKSSRALKEMCAYNIGDIIATEQLYLRLRPHIDHKLHLGVLRGSGKFSCVECGGHNLKLHKTTVTKGGSIKRIMKCKYDGVKFTWSNMNFLRWSANKVK
jgi:hypothetical protein